MINHSIRRTSVPFAALALFVTLFAAPAAAAPPSATTEKATEISASKAKLNATINPNGQETGYIFVYGTTTEYGSYVPLGGKSVGSGTSPVKVSEQIKGLNANTTYHFRIVAIQEGKPYAGEDEVFTTAPVTLADAESGKALTPGSAIKGVSTNSFWVGDLGMGNCLTPPELSGEVIKNGADRAVIEITKSPTFNCQLVPTGYTLKTEIVMPTIEIFADNAAGYEIKNPTKLSTYNAEGFLVKTCSYSKASSQSVTWAGVESLELSFTNVLPQENECWKFEFKGTFKLTQQNGHAIKVIQQ